MIIIDPSNPGRCFAEFLGSKDLQRLPMEQRRACFRFMTMVNKSGDKDAISNALAEALDELRELIAQGLVTDLALPDEPKADSEHVEPEPTPPQKPAEPKAIEPQHADPEVDIPDHIGFDTHGLLRVRVADIKPNRVNATVFTSSLGEESIRELADDIRARKLQYPIQIRPDMVTPDGERRQRALMMLDIDETYLRVVHGLDTPESVEDYVLDSYSSGRDAALDEKVRHYKLAQRVLQRRHGRPMGRPSKKSSSNDELFWDHRRVKTEAARRARLGSDVIADRAVSVFERGDADLAAKVVAGEVSISAAYAKLSELKADKKKANAEQKPKAKKTETTETTETDDAATEDERDQDSEQQPAQNQTEELTSSTQSQAGGEQPAHEDDTGSSESSRHGDGCSSTDAADQHDQSREAHEGGAEGDAKEATTSADRPPAITFKEAFPVVVRAIQRKPSDFARRVINKIGTEAGLTIWIRSNEPLEDLSVLDDHVTDCLRALAENDLDDATAWVESHVESIREILGAAEPTDDDGAEDYSDDSDEA
jgi:hypothetical protein